MFFKDCIKSNSSKVDGKSPKQTKFSYSVREDQNSESKKSMEDFTIAVEDLLGDQRWALFCILDGHGGADVASYIKTNYHHILKKYLLGVDDKSSIEDLISQSIEKLSKNLFEGEKFQSGSTFCGILFDTIKNEYYTINVGDSRAISAHFDIDNGNINWNVISLTVEHKLTNEAEKERVKKLGGVLNNRVGGQLLVTRALGDFAFQQYGLSAVPDVLKRKIEKEKFIMIGSDGIWDFLDTDSIIKILKDNGDQGSTKLSDIIMKEAMKKSIDNMSLIVLRIKD